MKFRYAIMYVENVEQTLAFYEQAFGLERAFLHASGDYGELNTGDTKLSFSSLELMTSLGKHPSSGNPYSPNFEIAFETDNVAGNLANALKAGAELVQDAEEMPWGQTTAYVRDLNGYLVEICTTVNS
ncbi:VOC family protein [Grimontia kaedaensis]|uniref:VOC family protein n=1 Tax=Grimontia kaedaensis TaxID=2872157 RepID=A0ABY4WQB9_9GAMM|nr:VOC family protein [Grimontia kaedaensis]USH01694.1 VOC family protein [Grimontia kaedaensis]